MIMGRDLITELKLIMDFDTQSVTWDNIEQPMKQQGKLAKETTHYEDLIAGLMAPARTVLETIYDESLELEHVHAAIKRQTKILDAHYEAANLKEIVKSIPEITDIERNKLLGFDLDLKT